MKGQSIKKSDVLNYQTLLPLRWVVIPPQHFLGLGRDTDTLKFYVGEYNGGSGVACLAGPFASMEVARSEFEFIAVDYAADVQEKVAQRIRDRADGKLAPDPTLADGFEWCRLQMLDDPKFFTLRARAHDFCATHTEAEIEASIKEELAAYDRQRREDDDGVRV